MKIALISCSKQKQNHLCRACEMYAPSNLFSKQFEYAKLSCDKVYILSAKYGLIEEDTLIEPYDVTLNDFSASEKSAWAVKVISELKQKTDIQNDTFYFFAGKNYYSDLIQYLPNYRLPLYGLAIGERLSKLDKLLNQDNQTMCDELHSLFLSLPRYNWETISNIHFNNGIYIVFEKGECYKGNEKIVRVGTHTSDGRLKQRLFDHFLKDNKDGSIFRKNIGKAMLNKNGDPYLPIWSLDTSKKENLSLIDADKQKHIENRVSNYMRKAFSFVVFQVDSKEDRLRFEEGIISSLNYEPSFIASPKWNGHYSTEYEIRQSGMWLKQGLNGHELNDEEFSAIERLCYGIKEENIASQDISKSVTNRRTVTGYKYQKLFDYFLDQTSQSIELGYSEIEKILDFQLPKSAYTYSAWWQDAKSHTHCKAWEDAGYFATNIAFGISKHKMTFIKK